MSKQGYIDRDLAGTDPLKEQFEPTDEQPIRQHARMAGDPPLSLAVKAMGRRLRVAKRRPPPVMPKAGGTGNSKVARVIQKSQSRRATPSVRATGPGRGSSYRPTVSQQRLQAGESSVAGNYRRLNAPPPAATPPNKGPRRPTIRRSPTRPNSYRR